jgi:hypothetical protein
MPKHQISDFAFNYLKEMAEPLVDTVETALDKLILEHQSFFGGPSRTEEFDDSNTYRRANLPDVKFTAIDAATIGGKPCRASWNHILEATIAACAIKGTPREDMKAILDANVFLGKRSDAGFRYVPEADISIQGLEANRAAHNILKLADRFEVSVRIDVAWPSMSKGAHPGSTKTLVGGP